MNPFKTQAERYDKWFESPRGRIIFEQEITAIDALIGDVKGRWLEVGVGTGRFAEALHIGEGIDPAEQVLAYASRRGIQTQVGTGEDLPYDDDSFDGLLMVVTICFLDDPAAALKEARRVLKPGGRLIVGLVPADSPWGTLYARKKNTGHSFYAAATFYTCEEVIALADKADLTFTHARSCLFTPPEEPAIETTIEKGIVPNAGFVALQFRKRQETPI